MTILPSAAQERLGREFFGFDRFADFKETEQSGERILVSPELQSQVEFTELIVSWNADTPEGSYLIAEARAIYDGRSTVFYTLGVWSKHSDLHPQTSVAGQSDADGQVSTDTLILNRPSTRFQLRVTLGGAGHNRPSLTYLGVSLCRPGSPASALGPDRGAWGKVLPVVERSQMAYPNGKVLCSPTTVSMLLNFWANRLDRPSLDKPVPEVADGVYDAAWKGAGNWSFNMAYAGSLPGVRAYVTRFGAVSEIEHWIAAGIPVGLSVDYDRLRAKGPGPNGHLVVCVGFTENGDIVINDPGTSKQVRKVFPRANFVDAWSCSHNTVYLIYPSNLEPPADRLGHWDSPKIRSDKTTSSQPPKARAH